MPLRPEQLERQLRDRFNAVYWVAGDEPLQHAESLSAIRTAAQQRGYTERLVIDGSASDFRWESLLTTVAIPSLLAPRRLLELRLDQGRLRESDATALARLIEGLRDDCLLIASPKLEAPTRKRRILQRIDSESGLVVVWPVGREQLPGWLKGRLSARGLRAEPAQLQAWAEQFEGNLPAAAQAIERLALVNGPGAVDPEAARLAVADSARFTPFDLKDAVLDGEPRRVLRIGAGLQEEGVAFPLVLGTLTADLRLAASLAHRAQQQGLGATLAAEKTLWERRRRGLRALIQRQGLTGLQQALLACQRLDRVGKGLQSGDPWGELLQLCVDLAQPRPESVGDVLHSR